MVSSIGLHRWPLWAALLAFMLPVAIAAPNDARLFTVVDQIQSARFALDDKKNAVFLSPDGGGYVSMLIHGDIVADGVWAEIIYGKLDSFATATPSVIARLFTDGLGSSEGFGAISGSPALLTLRTSHPTWLDTGHVAVIWRGLEGQNEIFSIDVVTREIKQLTHDDGDVVSFIVSKNGLIIYDVRNVYPRAPSQKLMDAGFTVSGTDAFVLLSGIVDGAGGPDFDICKRLVSAATGSQSQQRVVTGSEVFCEMSFFSQFEGSPGLNLISPNGKRAIVNVGMQRLPAEWNVYSGPFRDQLRHFESNPHGLSSQWINQLLVVNLNDGTSRLLWDAPAFDVPRSVPKIAWSADSRYVLIGPTLLPPNSPDKSGWKEDVVAVIDTTSGHYSTLPLGVEDTQRIKSVNWASPNTVVIRLADGTLRTFRRPNVVWEESSANRQTDFEARIATHSRMRVEVRQSMNDPPVLFAVDRRTGAGREIFNPNPDLARRFALGRVEMIEWKNMDGREWTGRLYFPANFEPHRLYPLVIQTHGFAGRDEYSLSGQSGPDGAPMGPTWSVFLAQPLASRGVAVLQIGGANAGPRPYGQATMVERLEEIVTAIQMAAEHLVDMGIVDRLRVGLMGHSATGKVVEHTIADSEFPFAAAIASDYADDDYVQAALSNWGRAFAGPVPFGRDLEIWLNHSPAFNAEQVRTPLQLELTSSGEGNSTFLWQWEMFSRLKYLHKPVELYVLPDIRHGSHLTQNPRQLLALQNRAMDWWLFWLLNEEDPDLSKAAQYAQWRGLREMHRDDVSRPKPPRLKWSASATGG
jgi:hypothetical protein